MNAADLQIRGLRSSVLPAVVAVHQAAFVGYKSTLLGPRFLDRFYEWFLVAPGAFGLVAAFGGDAAEEGGGVGGFAVGARLGSGPAITRFTAAAALQALIARPWLLAHPEIRAGLRLKLRQIRCPAPAASSLPGGADFPTAALAGIAVAPEYQGRGVGAHLMRAFEAEALRRGYRRAWLSVRRDNAAACRLYQRCGWDELTPSPSPTLLVYARLLEQSSPLPS